MATQNIAYGAKTAVAVSTFMNSLANGAASQSDAFDNTSTKADDFMVQVVSNALAGNVGVINVWVAASLSDTTYADGAGASAASFTFANRKNAVWLGSVQMSGATSQTSTLRNTVASIFGYVCPSKFVFIITNDSGAALAASGHSINVLPITYTVA